VEVSLDEDAQPSDDHLRAVLSSDQPPRIVVLDRRSFSGRPDLERLSSGAWMARAVQPGRSSRVQVDEIDPGSLDRALLARAEVVVVARPDLLTGDGWSMLRAFVDDGGAIVVAPAPEEVGQRWIERFRSTIAPAWTIAFDVEFAETPWRLAPQQPSSATLRMLGSELSVLGAPVTATRRLRAEAPASDAEIALAFEDGAPLLLAGRGPSQRGWVMLLASAPELEWTDLPVRPLMVPLMQEIVRQGRRLARTDDPMMVGSRVAVPRGAATLVRRDGGGARSSSIVVDPDGRTRDPVMTPGLYEARDEAGRSVGVVAVNVDSARANIEANEPSAVQAWLQSSGPWTTWGEAADEIETTTSRLDAPWSVALLVAACILAVGEMVIARILSRSGSTEAAA